MISKLPFGVRNARLYFWITGLVFFFFLGAAAALAQSLPNLPVNDNAAFLASQPRNNPTSDVILPAGIDLEAYVRSSMSAAKAATLAPPLIIPAADANGDTQMSNYFFSFADGSYRAGSGCHMAPVYLPHGGGGSIISIDNFYIFAYDNDAANDMTYFLYRKQNNTTASATILADVTTTGASSNIQVIGDTTVATPVVTNQYSYYVAWCWPVTNGLFRSQGFWIFYTES